MRGLRWDALSAGLVTDTADGAGQVALQISNHSAKRITLPISTVLAEVASEDYGPLADWEEWQDHLDKAHAGVVSDKPFLSRFNVSHLPAEIQEKTLQLLEKHQNAFIEDGKLAPPTPVLQYKVNIAPDVQPVARPPYHVSHSQEQAYDEEVQKWLDLQVIEEANSPWAAPISMVTRALPGGKIKRRLVCDFRAQNALTHRDNFPPPNMDNLINSLHGANYITVLDVSNAYLCVEIAEESRDFFGLVTTKGTYRCRRMMFGAKNSGAMYCRLMQKVMEGQKGCKWYVDDLIIYSTTIEEHFVILSEVLTRLANARLLLKAEKAVLLQEEVRFLGYFVSGKGIRVDPEKVRAVLEFPIPTKVRHVQQFLGLVGFSRRLIKSFASKAMPLFPLTGGDKNRPLEWSVECQTAFDCLKQAMTTAPVMALPDWSVGAFIIRADASGRAIGGSLNQVQKKYERIILYWSRKMSKAEQATSVTEQEALAIVEIVKHCNWYLQGYKIIVYSDHKPLSFLGGYRSFVNPKINRWQLFLSQFDVEFRWIKGSENKLPDALSRAFPEGEEENSDSDQEQRATDTSRVRKIALKVAPVRLAAEADAFDPIPDFARYRREQERDPEFGTLLAELESGVESERFVVHEGLLYRRPARDERYARLVVPASMRAELLQAYHSAPWAGHCGSERMHLRVKQRHYWPGLCKQVYQHARACHACALRKRGNHGPPAPLQPHSLPSRPFETVSTDLVGPLPTSDPGGYKWIVTMMCLATKFVEAVPARTGTAEEVAQILVNQLIARYGTPSYLISDNGSCYVADMFREMCKLLGVRQVRCTPLRAQANGALERQHRTLGESLTMYVNGKGTDWPENLQLVVMSMRSAVNKATGETPYYLLTGFDMILPYDLITAPGRVPTNLSENPLGRLQVDAARVFREVRERVRQAAKRSKQYYDRRAKEPDFKVGQLVYLRVPVKGKGLGRKFRPRYSGPWRLVEQLTPVTWTLRKLYGHKSTTVHADRLKLCRGPDDILSAHARDQALQPESQSGGLPADDGEQTCPRAGGSLNVSNGSPTSQAELPTSQALARSKAEGPVLRRSARV